jgi:hypothetical protein
MTAMTAAVITSRCRPLCLLGFEQRYWRSDGVSKELSLPLVVRRAPVDGTRVEIATLMKKPNPLGLGAWDVPARSDTLE